MSNETKPEASSDPSSEARQQQLKHQALEQAEVPEVLAFLQKHGITIVVGVALAVIAYVGHSVWRNVERAKEVEAMNLLMTARSADQLASILIEYPDTDAAPLALFSQASGRFDEASYPVARDLFRQFIEQYPNHDLVPNARLALAQCQEALGMYEEALTAFAAFGETHPEHYLAPMARFGEGRCLEQLGRYDEAVAVFQAYLDAEPDGPWAPRAETSIKFVDMARRDAARGGTPAAAGGLQGPTVEAATGIPVITP